MMATIRVLVVEDSLTVRRRLCDVLATDPALEVVGEASNAVEALQNVFQCRPDVLLTEAGA